MVDCEVSRDTHFIYHNSLTAFTAILAVYILMNIGRAFLTDNLLEPMLVSYSITVVNGLYSQAG